MQTHLADFMRGTAEGAEAEAILRKCVHCGFCNATCPTYQLLGDELDGPRGRIYLVKEVLEGHAATARTRLHLDRCLTCRACETTCPSGVRYARLADIGRRVVEERVPRGLLRRVRRGLLAFALPRTRLFGAALALGQALRPLLPPSLKARVPPRAVAPGARPPPRHARKVLVLGGCVQPVLAPNITAAAARVLDRVGISIVEAGGAGCCGALRFHLNDQDAGRGDMRALIDAWWPALESGEVEAIAMTASGCGATVREYGDYLAGDSAYRVKAARVGALTRDLAEIVAAEAAALERALPRGRRHGSVVFQSPCSLQHGQKVRGVVEGLLARAGYEVVSAPDGHLCCGSAGAYSILQPELSQALRARKLAALHSAGAHCVATANIGCLVHLQAGTGTPVRHWIELIDMALQA